MARIGEFSSITHATGGCLCGEVRYEINGPLHNVLTCHCEQCRRTSGHFVAATAAELENFRLTEEKGLRWFHSSAIARRGFCATCGSSLFWDPAYPDEHEGPRFISIMAGTLDSPTGLETTGHIYLDFKGDYYDLADGKPQFTLNYDGDSIDPSAIDAVIFDLDQTLVDRQQTFVNFLHGQHQRWAEQFADLSVDDYIRFVLSLDNNGYADKAMVYDSVATEFNLADGSAAQLYADYQEQYGLAPVLYPGAHELLTRLATKYKLGLITNGRTIGQTRKIEGTKIAPYFETILISETEGIKKPDARIFERCLQRMDVEAGRSVYIGDNPTNDVNASRLLGMKAIWVDQGRYKPSGAADAIIHEIAELEALFIMQADVRIERATLDDVPQINALVNAAYQQYVARIGSPPGPMLDDYAEHVRENVAFVSRSHDGGVTGLLVLIEFDDYLLLDNVAVDPSAQGQGLGKRLMSFAEKIASERGFAEIRLYTHESMTENQAIYKRLGYEEFERKIEKGFARVYMKKVV